MRSSRTCAPTWFPRYQIFFWLWRGVGRAKRVKEKHRGKQGLARQGHRRRLGPPKKPRRQQDSRSPNPPAFRCWKWRRCCCCCWWWWWWWWSHKRADFGVTSETLPCLHQVWDQQNHVREVTETSHNAGHESFDRSWYIWSWSLFDIPA